MVIYLRIISFRADFGIAFSFSLAGQEWGRTRGLWLPGCSLEPSCLDLLYDVAVYIYY